ncbi:MAG: FadR family transcriptional regulator [Angelakisella sp.]|nr:FadR family transcriptional regulator [Angelakisella sp.]
MEFEKLISPSLKELFISNIEAKILSGELPVGQQLPPERQLAQSMGVSRAVVNSGIVELENRGFLDVRPRVGTFVADYRRAGTMETLKSIMTYNRGRLRNEEIRSILEVRDALDKLAVADIIPHVTELDNMLLLEKVEAIRQASDNRQAAEAAFAFQHELAMLSGNTLLPLIFRSFYSSVLVLWERFCALHGIDTLYQTSCRLCGHIRDKDIPGAVAWIDYCTRETISGSRCIYY